MKTWEYKSTYRGSRPEITMSDELNQFSDWELVTVIRCEHGTHGNSWETYEFFWKREKFPEPIESEK